MTPLSSLLGGGGLFVPDQYYFDRIENGATGDILIVTPASSNKRIRLLYLQHRASTGVESGLSVKRGSTTMFSGDLAAIGPPPYGGDFLIGASGEDGSAFQTGVIDLDYGETLTITKETGSTTNFLYYGYAIGE